ncbi:MAG: glycosyltransferase, partial [Candidatus Bathyarchaeia archaeon]
PPMTLLEALSSGTPVIASMSPSMLDYRGLHMGVKDDEWHEILSIISDDDLLREYGEKARKYMVESHGYDSIMGRLKELLQWV